MQKDHTRKTDETIKNIWFDWIRKKVARNNLEARAIGGGPFNKHILTNSEECVARICGIFATVEGISNSRSFGAVTSFCISESEEEPLQTSRETVVTLRAAKRLRVSENRDSLLTYMTHNQMVWEKFP